MISPPNTVDPPVPWRPTGHPIRWFVLAVAVVAIGCVVCWWAALVNPRLSSSSNTGFIDTLTNEGDYSFDLRNEAMTAFEVRSVEVDSPGVTTTGVYVDGQLADADVRVAGGQVVTVKVTFQQTDCSQDLSGTPAFLNLDISTIVGIERTTRLPMEWVPWSKPCGEISRSSIPGKDH